MARLVSYMALVLGAALVAALHQVSLVATSSSERILFLPPLLLLSRSETNCHRDGNDKRVRAQHQKSSSSSSSSSFLLTSVPRLAEWRQASWLSSKGMAWYNWDRSTEENYQLKNPTSAAEAAWQSANEKVLFFGKYAGIRATLDYSFHRHYTRERQLFQDTIIDSFLFALGPSQQQQQQPWVTDYVTGRNCSSPIHPWLVLTAGAMGAGKSYTVRHLAQRGLFPLHAFVTVDADQVRRMLPEFDVYAQRDPERAGELTRKEAGYIVEILTEAALQQGRNVLVDGSLRDAAWYQTYLQRLKQKHAQLKVCILHVTAPRDAILQRARSRAKETGRVVPRDVLESAMVQVPRSVDKLRSQVDVTVELRNSPNTKDVQLQTPGMNWESFRQTWQQQCPATIGRRMTT